LAVEYPEYRAVKASIPVMMICRNLLRNPETGKDFLYDGMQAADFPVQLSDIHIQRETGNGKSDTP